MDFKGIRSAAQSYTDRYDQELDSAIPSFMRVVSPRSTAQRWASSLSAQIYRGRARVLQTADDFGGFRDVELVEKGSANLGNYNEGSPFGGRTLPTSTPSR